MRKEAAAWEITGGTAVRPSRVARRDLKWRLVRGAWAPWWACAASASSTFLALALLGVAGPRMRVAMRLCLDCARGRI